jgi:HD-GYP domain-containing protein (c-di-GMP phosphodiesterase class II)
MNISELSRYLNHIGEELNDNTSLALEELRDVSELIDGSMPYGDGHAKRVADYALEIAESLCFKEYELVKLEVSSLLHDLGKLILDDNILLKQTGLTATEKQVIQTHPVLGCCMLEDSFRFVDVLNGIKHHHEWFDGSGYPSGYARNKIPLISRIIAVADAYDAMTSWRPYRKPKTKTKALEELISFAGTQFDPVIVALFIRTERPKNRRQNGN